MTATNSLMKAKAVDVLEELGVNRLFRFIFDQEDKLLYFDAANGSNTASPIDERSELYRMAKDVERKTHCKVYAVLHSRMFFGETYDFLLISNYLDDFDAMHTRGSGHKHSVYAYCYNVSYPELSESGFAIVIARDGFITRIG